MDWGVMETGYTCESWRKLSCVLFSRQTPQGGYKTTERLGTSQSKKNLKTPCQVEPEEGSRLSEAEWLLVCLGQSPAEIKNPE